MTDARNALLRGATEPPARLRTLRAGPLTAQLDGIDLRYVRVGATELMRRIYVAVRDQDWDTVPGTVSGLTLDESGDGFRIEFDVRHARREIDFRWHGTITGSPSGRVEYVFDGRAERDLLYNRIGICVHHPWRETAGAAYTAHTPAGEITGSFPALIGQQMVVDGVYHALFPAFDRIEVALGDDSSLLLEFEGDLWETEDHRNWTDANFKTYSTPISLGFPHRLEAGQALRQRVVLTPLGVTAKAGAGDRVRVTVGGETGTRVPPIGLGADRDEHTLDEREAGLLAALHPGHLRTEVRLDRDDWRSTLATAQDAARRVGCALELALMLRAEHEAVLPEVAAALAAGPTVDRVLVTLAGCRTATPDETTPASLVDLVHAALGASLPAASFIGGTEMYFTEINRTRPDPASWDGVCYSISPQVHAFTDLDVVENLDAQAETIRSALVLAAGKPVVVSPITLRRRVNFHAAENPPPTPPGELPDCVDVRQSSLLGAAWTAGSLKYVCEAGADAVTYYETTGWCGVLERREGTPLPAKFVSAPGQVFPLYYPLADVAGWRGADVLACESSDGLAAVALAVRTEDGATRLLVANLTPVPCEVTIGPLSGAVTLRRLNEETAATATAEPEAFRGSGEPAAPEGGELALTLGPYEVVRIDPQ
jgi:hypothetical protein